MLVDHFADDEEIPELFQAINVDFGGLEEGLDPGVAFEATKTYEELSSHLGYDSHGRSAMFNTHRHTGAKRPTPSSDPALFEAFRKLGSAHPEAESFEAIAFHYHQVQGVHSTVRQFFTDQPSPDNALGIVIADAPGLGKTAMAIAIIAFLISIGLRQDKGLKPPPIVGECPCYRHLPLADLPDSLGARPYLGGSRTIPDLATLIIAPGTLTAQWYQEFGVFAKPDVIAVFRFPTAKAARSKFFSEDGPFATSSVPLRNRVIIATQSVSSYQLGIPPKTYTRIPHRPFSPNLEIFTSNPMTRKSAISHGLFRRRR
jgi:TATA-binding protein-associated factor